MVPFFVKRLLLAFVLLGLSLLFFRQAPKDTKLWYKPRWLHSGGLYLAGAVMLIGGSILLVITILEAMSR
jgi:hypothetical protein